MNMENMQKLFMHDPNAYYTGRNGMIARSVHFRDRTRFSKAEEESRKVPASAERVAEIVLDCLKRIGLPQAAAIWADPRAVDYAAIRKQYRLKDKGEILFLKFSADGFIGVIGTGSEINFDYPPCRQDYNKRTGSDWAYHTSGILLSHVNKIWDQGSVMICPLRIENLPFTRRQVATAVGNYLSEQGVPIIDYYSHHYPLRFT